MRIKLPQTLLLLLLAASALFWVYVYAFQKKHAHGVAHADLKSAMPLVASNLDSVVANLSRETTAESVAKLSDLSYTLGILPGLTSSAQGPEDYDVRDIRWILSNRRFLKAYAELQKLDKAGAAKIVNSNLLSALNKYLPEYDSYFKQLAPLYKITNTSQLSTGPMFLLTAPTNQPEKEVLSGLRLKILSLVWISGLLNLSDNKDQVERVVQMAIKQRNDLHNDLTLTPIFKLIMQKDATLYNRQILSSGLIGVTSNEKGVETSAMNVAGIHWLQSTQTAYQAVLTKSDIPVQFGVMEPDYSSGRFVISFASKMRDTNFDLLLKEIGFKP
jgi:hypothetical protein